MLCHIATPRYNISTQRLGTSGDDSTDGSFTTTIHRLYSIAWEAVQKGFQLAQSLDSTAMVMWLLPATAVLLQHQGKTKQAVKLMALALTHPLSPTEWMKKWVLLHEIQAAMQPELATAVANQPTLSLEKGLTEIAKIVDVPYTEKKEGAGAVGVDTAVAANQALMDPLTNRELEVLQLIAAGLSNRQIAEKLFIAPGTVKYYTSNIYSKLQVNGRTQAVAQARELGILKT